MVFEDQHLTFLIVKQMHDSSVVANLSLDI